MHEVLSTAPLALRCACHALRDVGQIQPRASPLAEPVQAKDNSNHLTSKAEGDPGPSTSLASAAATQFRDMARSESTRGGTEPTTEPT